MTTCQRCNCKSDFENGAAIQKPPNPSCPCFCHSAYWMIHGEQFRQEVKLGTSADAPGATRSLRLLRG